MILILILSVLTQESDPARVRELVAQLSSDSIRERELAARQLAALGEAVVPVIEQIRKELLPAETAERLKTILVEIRRSAVRETVCPPVRPVSIDARDQPLGEILKDLGRQGGVELSTGVVRPSRRISFAAQREPLLKALDRLAEALGEVRVGEADGRLLFETGKPPRCPTAYGEGFRARLKRIIVTEQNRFEAPELAVVLYIEMSRLPTIKPRFVRYAGTPVGTDPDDRQVFFKPAFASGMATAQSGSGVVLIEDVPVPFDAEHPLADACVLKGAPADLRVLSSLTVRIRAGFAAGSRTLTWRVTEGRVVQAPADMPVQVMLGGGNILIIRSNSCESSLDSLLQMESIVVRKGDEKFQTMPMRADPNRRIYRLDGPATRGGETTVEISAFGDLFEREVAFEFRDVRLRN